MPHVLRDIQGIIFPSDVEEAESLTVSLVDLAKMLRSYGLTIRVLERYSQRYIDVHCSNDLMEYENDWSELESTYYEPSTEDSPVSYTHLTLPTICSV